MPTHLWWYQSGTESCKEKAEYRQWYGRRVLWAHGISNLHHSSRTPGGAAQGRCPTDLLLIHRITLDRRQWCHAEGISCNYSWDLCLQHAQKRKKGFPYAFNFLDVMNRSRYSSASDIRLGIRLVGYLHCLHASCRNTSKIHSVTIHFNYMRHIRTEAI